MALSPLKKPIGIRNHSMAKIIFTSRYIRNASRAGNFVKYMGTREGVEKLPYGVDHSPATKKQDDLIASIVKNILSLLTIRSTLSTSREKKKPPRQSSLTLSSSAILIALAILKSWFHTLQSDQV